MLVDQAKEATLTADRLREIVTYDAIGGSMKWLSAQRRGQEVGWITEQGYRKTIIRRRKFLVHRLAWLYVYGVWPSQLIDHINGCCSDNRIENLREASRSQNAVNRQFRPVNGAWRNKCGWEARIRFDGQRTYLGTFPTEEAARTAYHAKARELHGEFSPLIGRDK